MNIENVISQITGKTYIKCYDKTLLTEWLSWYRGKVKRFHNYTIYNGKKRVPMERFSLGMAKKSCEDWANLLLNEKTNIVFDDDASQKTIEKIFVDTKFWAKANKGIELSFALGQGAFVEGVDNFVYDNEGNIISNGTPSIQFVNNTKIYPLNFDSNTITECAFINEVGDKTYINIHIKDEEGNYVIHNVKCNGLSKGNNLRYDEEKDHTIFYTKQKVPFFQIVKPNIQNNANIDLPIGISIYANSIDILKSIDLGFDCMYNELNLGRKRVFISAKALTLDPVSGEPIEVFDQNDIEYYTLPEDADGKTLVQDNTQQLRIEQQDKALQRFLNLYSNSVGLGTNHYKFDAQGMATATQVISEDNSKYQNIRKQEIELENVLIGVVKALTVIVNNYTQDHIKEDANIQIVFDDSIIEDKQSEKASARQELQDGIISKAEYRARFYGEDIDVAQKNIKDIALQNNATIISDIASIRNDISHETALELNPYIDNVEEELKRIEEESASAYTINDNDNEENNEAQTNYQEEE